MSRFPWHWIAVPLGFALLVIGGELALRARYRKHVPRGAPAAGRVTIVALGDSTAAGWPGGPGAGWPALLAERLQTAYPRAQWRVCNAGIPGDTAPQGYARFDRDVMAASPQVVLIAFGLNDCDLARYGMDRWLEDAVPVGMGRSFLWRAGMVRLERIGWKLGLAALPRAEEPPAPEPRTSPDGFSRALQALVDRARVLGALPVLLTMTPLADAGERAARVRVTTYPIYDERIRDAAARNGVPLVELATGAPAGMLLADGIHLTEDGQGWVAGQVFRQLGTAGVWRKFAKGEEP